MCKDVTMRRASKKAVFELNVLYVYLFTSRQLNLYFGDSARNRKWQFPHLYVAQQLGSVVCYPFPRGRLSPLPPPPAVPSPPPLPLPLMSHFARRCTTSMLAKAPRWFRSPATLCPSLIRISLILRPICTRDNTSGLCRKLF